MSNSQDRKDGAQSRPIEGEGGSTSESEILPKCLPCSEDRDRECPDKWSIGAGIFNCCCGISC